MTPILSESVSTFSRVTATYQRLFDEGAYESMLLSSAPLHMVAFYPGCGSNRYPRMVMVQVESANEHSPEKRGSDLAIVEEQIVSNDQRARRRSTNQCLLACGVFEAGVFNRFFDFT
uniref:Uncharacterized protein n=1 Tax=Anopheles coluzzii TaxID=1518534 RepID=A0A8W7P0D4_ANOCL